MAAPRDTYLIIADDLRKKIKDGTYTHKLPVTAKIGLEYGVVRSVAMRAVNLLREEGLLHVVHGGGIYVAGSIDTRPLKERITDLLRDGELSIGSLFPSEAELCERFGVSRTGLRPALARLEGQGLIGTRGGRGRVVLALPDKEDA